MIISRLLSLSIIFSVFVVSAASQDTVEKSKETEQQQIALLEQIAKDAEGLRLSENRASVAAKLGDGFCKIDEKRARLYFQSAISDLVVAQTQAQENKKQAAMLYGLINGVSPRQEILTLMATCDADLALESYYKSRPAKIAQILMNPEEMKKPSSQQFVQSEIYFEQTLITRVSEQNPQRALKLIRESLAKGVTFEVFGLIDKIKLKDMELAVQLANEVGDMLLASDFDKANQDFSLATSYVTQYGKKPEEGEEKPVKVDEKRLRELTSRLARMIIKAGDEYAYEIENLMPIVQKYSPENLAVFKQRLAKLLDSPERREANSYEKLMASEPSSEKLLTEAEKFSEAYRSQVYYAAAEKSAQNGNIMQAQKIISSKMSQEDSESYLTQINYGLISKAMTDGKLDEAAFLINDVSDENSRLGFLIQLATAIYQQNPADNKKKTMAVLDQARVLVGQPAETIEDISNLMQLAITMAEIEPDQAFHATESMMAPINEYIEAAAVVSKYRSEGTIRQGEMLVSDSAGLNGLYNMNGLLATLKSKDFKRTMNLINGFQRMEIRLGLLLQIVNPNSTEMKPESESKIKTGG